jgi:hypothetical protein
MIRNTFTIIISLFFLSACGESLTSNDNRSVPSETNTTDSGTSQPITNTTDSETFQSETNSSESAQFDINTTDDINTTNDTNTLKSSNKILIGAQMSEESASAAPFDSHYLYIAGGGVPEESCIDSCKSSESCGGWWGCWQWDELPPGQYISKHIENSASATWQGDTRPQIPVFTYYIWLNTAKSGEGSAEVAALNDATTLTRYFNDWRFLLQKVGNKKVMLHIEPDLWGFVRSVDSNPHNIPASVSTANPTDCSGQENSATGFAKCMIAMARKYAPNATVGLHASPWNSTQDGDAEKVASFMSALGATDGDFIVTDPADRDAGWYEIVKGESNHWWNDQQASAYLAWSKTLSEKTGKSTIIWQIPLGNMNQNNTDKHYKDNRLDWFFAHIDDAEQAHVKGLFFGAGENHQTTPETDGGNLINKTISNWEARDASFIEPAF